MQYIGSGGVGLGDNRARRESAKQETMQIPSNIPKEARKVLEELFGAGELAGFWISEDFKRIQARVFVDGQPSSQTWERDEQTGEYKLTGYSGLGRPRL